MPSPRKVSPAPRSAVSVFTPPGRWRAESRTVARFLRAALRRLGRPLSVEVYLVSSGEMRTLNREYRGVDAPTTVLSFGPMPIFPGRLGGGAASSGGEIYLAPAVIRARGEGIERFALHGLLHLFGYTHARKRDTMRMERKEERLLKSF